MNDDDELPLLSLWRQSKSPKRKGKTKTGLSPSPRRRRSNGKSPKKTQLRHYGFNGDLLGDATDIVAFKIAHKKDIPAKNRICGPRACRCLHDRQPTAVGRDTCLQLSGTRSFRPSNRCAAARIQSSSRDKRGVEASARISIMHPRRRTQCNDSAVSCVMSQLLCSSISPSCLSPVLPARLRHA